MIFKISLLPIKEFKKQIMRVIDYSMIIQSYSIKF